MNDSLDIRAHPEGLTLPLRVKPKAREDRLLGLHGGAIKVSVRAAPEKGQANEAVCRLLAERLGIPLRSIEILTGASSQDKTVLIRGLDRATLAERLAL